MLVLAKSVLCCAASSEVISELNAAKSSALPEYADPMLALSVPAPVDLTLGLVTESWLLCRLAVETLGVISIKFRGGKIGLFRGGRRRQAGHGGTVVSQSALVVLLDFVVNFLAMHWHFARSLDAELDYVTFHPDNFHSYPAINYDALAKFA
jgi:hypothetical protein